MNHYFVVAYFQTALAPDAYAGINIDTAMERWNEQSKVYPCDLFRFNEETKMIEGYDGTKIWIPLYRAWVVVRCNPGFTHPETIICHDGIFETIAEAESYIKNHGGSWKIYDFDELQNKMAESIQLLRELNSDQHEECPF